MASDSASAPSRFLDWMNSHMPGVNWGEWGDSRCTDLKDEYEKLKADGCIRCPP